MLHALFTHKNTHTMTFYYYLKPNMRIKSMLCVCVCNQRNAKVVAMVVFFQQCTYSIHGLHVFEEKNPKNSGLRIMKQFKTRV